MLSSPSIGVRKKFDGFTTQELRLAGCSVNVLLELGYYIKSAGFSARELRLSGCSSATLVSLGYKSFSLLQAGFSIDDINRSIMVCPP